MARDNKKVIEQLNRILECELAGVVRYTHYSMMIFGFSRIPIVHDRDELWLRKYGDEEDGRLPAVPLSAEPPLEPVHMPRPSFWPILLAGSLLVMVGGLLLGIGVVVIGGMLTLYCIVRFALEYHRRPSGYEIMPALGPGTDVRGEEA